MKKEHIYIIKVDKVCSCCGYRNKIDEKLNESITIIACGKCGKFIKLPDNFLKEDKKVVGDLIEKVIKEGSDAFL